MFAWRFVRSVSLQTVYPHWSKQRPYDVSWCCQHMLHSYHPDIDMFVKFFVSSLWVLMMYLSIYHIVRTSCVFNFTELCLLMTIFGPGPVIDHQKKGHETLKNDVFTSDILCRYNYYLPRHLTYWGRDKMANIFQTNFQMHFFLIIFF